MITCTRYHDISCGHRVVGHENKCRNLHGHNYRVHFTCAAVTLDGVGRVIDFGIMKERLCFWLEDNWDHMMLLWNHDPLAGLGALSHNGFQKADGVVLVPFNPTAENMAEYLLNTMGPHLLEGTGVTLVEVTVEETAKCSATAKKSS